MTRFLLVRAAAFGVLLTAAPFAFAPPFALAGVALAGFDFQGNVATSDRAVYYAGAAPAGNTARSRSPPPT